MRPLSRYRHLKYYSPSPSVTFQKKRLKLPAVNYSLKKECLFRPEDRGAMYQLWYKLTRFFKKDSED